MEEQSAPAQPLTLWALLILSLCPVAAFLGDLWNWTPGAAACALLAPALLAAAVRLEPRSLAVVAVLSGVCCVVETLLRQTHPGATLGLGYCLFAAVTLASGATLAGAGAALDRREIGRLRWQKDQLVRELYERERILRDLSADGPALETPVELATAAERISTRNLQDPPDPKQTGDHEDNISYALLLLTLQDISQRISTNLDLESLVPTIISTARASLDCESCQVWLWNAREQTLRNPLPERSRDQHEYSPRVATGLGRWVIEKRQILTRSSVEEDLALHPLFEEEDGHLPDAVAPLAVGGELIGLLVVDRTAEDTSRFLRLLYILADIYALGIKNAQLFHRVQEMARRDGLTGLLNHASFREQLDDLLATRTEPQQPVAIIMGDIDHFKKINDSRGHLAGDEVLRKQGNLWKASLPDRAIAARYGGEEFIAAVPDCDAETAVHLANELRQVVESFGIDFEGQTLHITSSFGVMASEACGETSSRLIERADKALYIAKHGGRNRVVCWSESNSETSPAPAASPSQSGAALPGPPAETSAGTSREARTETTPETTVHETTAGEPAEKRKPSAADSSEEKTGNLI